MKKNNFGLLESDIAYIFAVLEKYTEIDKAVIFGSRAMGNYKNGSDIDIAIFGKQITNRILSKINYKLNETIPIPYFIDVVHFEIIKNKNLKKHILEKGIIMYKCKPHNT